MLSPHQDVIDQLNRSVVRPEAGEIRLIEFLCAHLGKEYEIYFQPFLNGDRPDVIIMLKGYGILILEVKDWDLSNYRLDERKRWIVKANGARAKSPIDQVLQYKENLYNLHIPGLLESKIRNYKHWAIVSCAVYFHCATAEDVRKLIIDPFAKDEKYQKFISHYDLLGNDNLTPAYIKNLLYKRYLSQSRPVSRWFNDSLYASFCQILKPPYHSVDEGVAIDYTPEQKRLITSSAREQRIKGVVGSGKTCVLAARAVSAHKRTGSRVLILTYNITLKNYIHDAISKVRDEFTWDSFYITNYHQFAKQELNNAGVQLETPPDYDHMSDDARSQYWESRYFSNVALFLEHTALSQKYDAIMIDEVQDYRYEWLEVVKQCFLRPGGEYVLFGDEKQNIYDLELTERDVRTNVPQRPTRMNETFRLNQALADTTLDYQKQCMSSKYNIDGDMIVQRKLSYGLIEYQEPNAYDPQTIVSHIRDFLSRSRSHPNDMAVLGFTIDYLRKIDCLYRHISGHQTTTMFETEEIYRKMLVDAYRQPTETIRSGFRLIGKRLGTEDLIGALVALWVGADLCVTYADPALHARLSALCEKYSVSEEEICKWASRSDVHELLAKSPLGFRGKVRDVRDNKKYHFWGNAGTTKFSTIHSFKGWEVESLIVCIEPKYENGEFKCSFDELIYTGFTRSRTNLLLINCGNSEHRDALRAVFGNIRNGMPNNRLEGILDPLRGPRNPQA